GASWRDKVLGIGTDDSRGEEGFEFLEGDIVKSSVNGILDISFFNRIQQILVRNMASIVVVFLSSMMVWIRLPGLLGFLYKKKILEEIGGLIGTVTRLDFQIDKGLRGKFARMVEKTKETSPEVGKAVESSESFVPWMLVERRTWRNSRAR
ncbi:hypothetical protein Goklo_012579, partial [Gossypium klotzschianum]|nr:hypothetical protein [Gossypium klotzschianum]